MSAAPPACGRLLVASMMAGLLGACGHVPASSGRATIASAADADAGVAVDAFYRARLQAHAAGHAEGLPDSAQLGRQAPLLTEALLQRLQRARVRQAIWIAIHDAAGTAPLSEGDLFSSARTGEVLLGFVVADTVAVGVDVRQTTVDLQAHTPQAGAPTIGARHWRDQAVLRREQGRWKLDDIVFAAAPSRGSSRRLSEMLDEAFE